MTIQLARCHICAALLADEADDRRQHVATHNHDEKRDDAATRAIRRLGASFAELNDAVQKLQAQFEALTELAPTEGGTGSLVINEIPDEDLDAELEDDEDEPIEDHDDPDLADLNDIEGVTPQNAEILAAETPSYPAIDRDDEDDLDLRIARQTGVIA
jgi:hypothetical protein